jgi:thiol-disulfide isomerase/thioredoxin
MNRTFLLLLLVTTAAALSGCSKPESTSDAGATAPAVVAEAKTESQAAPAAEPNVPLDPILSYEAIALDGSKYRVGDRKGKVVLINAWATWCGPCRYEIPELKRLHQEYADDGLEIVGVSIDMAQAEGVVREFVRINGITYPILLDPESRLTAVLRTTSIPTSIMIDRAGNVVWRHIGIVSEQRDAEFRAVLAKALGN